MFSSCPYFDPKLLLCLRAFFPNLLVEFFCCCCYFRMSCFACIFKNPVSIFFSLLSFTKTFWFISLICIVSFSFSVSFFFSVFPLSLLWLILLYSLQDRHTIVGWWFYSGVWVATSLLRSPGFFSVFWTILTMLDCFDSSTDFQLI